MQIHKYVAIAGGLTLAAPLMACSDQTCSPRTYQSCLGPDACHGVQICAADGSAWSLCDCGSGLYGLAGSSAIAGDSSIGGGSTSTGGTNAQGGTGGTGDAGQSAMQSGGAQ